MANQTVLPWIQTYTGKKFDFLNPDADSVCIEDIAHALSNICRYTGHTKEFYSVAQHSVLAVNNVPDEDSLAALLHDATESYLTDISKPLKTLLPQYRKLEYKVYKVITEKFGLPDKLPDSVKEADLRLLATEKRDLLIGEPDEWTIIKTVKPYPEKIEPWNPKKSETIFLDLYTDIISYYDDGDLNKL
ncbi:MAG: HD family hydrolase [Candidatus Acididesulfobacter guangdongensis]|uniref:HD family hydrolase n=1 Tax=Acididesulfobacter guangdongensis TaxID=2597225 RepID=A0A519BH60_ACIG2|nr:MAG: HD family hydrolase [Candidatus Acididesulfobacter guangdongensis]